MSTPKAQSGHWIYMMACHEPRSMTGWQNPVSTNTMLLHGARYSHATLQLPKKTNTNASRAGTCVLSCWISTRCVSQTSAAKMTSRAWSRACWSNAHQNSLSPRSRLLAMQNTRRCNPFYKTWFGTQSSWISRHTMEAVATTSSNNANMYKATDSNASATTDEVNINMASTDCGAVQMSPPRAQETQART